MSTDLNYHARLETLEATLSLADSLASACHGGEVFELQGDLGAGKTTFVAAFVAALGYRNAISSPTFSLQNIYELDDRKIYHFDLYRLDDLGVIAHELDEALDDEHGITIIEWLKDIKIKKEVITISLAADADENARQLQIVAPASHQYILKGLKTI